MKKYHLITTIFAIVAIGQLSVSLSAPIPHNNSFSFYGKVIDQKQQPLAGVAVKIGVTSDLPENNYEEVDKEYILKTDQNGKFALTGVFGFGMQITSITKSGYELSAKGKRSYAHLMSPEITHPDSNNPVVFKMWQQAGKEPLANSAWHGKVACDGTTNRFDLATGLKSENGDFEVVCTRDPINLPPANVDPYTYKFQLSLVGGAIQSTKDEFTYLAPENGYLPNLTFGQKADAAKWDRSTPIPEEYYFKTAEGKYGRLWIKWDFAFAQSPTYLQWNCSINPSGSRNLER